MCCGSDKGPKWKREIVKGHKFDCIDVREFRDDSCGAKFSYMLMFVAIIKNILTMTADLYTAVSLLVIGNSSINADASIPPEVAKWIFLGAILVSFILLFWDIIKARGIIKTKDISLAFFAAIANGWYSATDYNYFCLFRKINDSRKRIDSIAFFVFFTLKSWKRILLAEAPRQVINIVTLITIVPKWIHINNGLSLEYDGLGKTRMQQVMTGTMIFSVVVFGVSFILFCAAAIIYVPLLCHIQGNLKEYCCHKADKRIEELLRKQSRKKMKGDEQAKKSQKNDIEMRSLAHSAPPNRDVKQVFPQTRPQINPHNRLQQQDSFSSQPSQKYGHSNQPSYSSQRHIQQPSYSSKGHTHQPSYSSQGHIRQPSNNNQGNNQKPNVNSHQLGNSLNPNYNNQQSYISQSSNANHPPGFYQQPLSAHSSNVSTVTRSQYVERRNSLSSVGSEQVGLISHAQPPPRSLPYNNLPNPNIHQQYQQYPNDHQQKQQQKYQNYY